MDVTLSQSALEMPAMFFVEPTNHCNMHCTFCPSDELTKTKRNATDDDIELYIRQVHRLKQDTQRDKVILQFNVLGEPLLNKNIYRYIALCKELGIHALLITNITLITEENLSKLYENNDFSLVLSLQTPTAESYLIRKYDHLDFVRYMELIELAVIKKFTTGSRVKIQIHISANNQLENDLNRERGGTLWSVYQSNDEQRKVMEAMVGRFTALGERMRSEYPVTYDEQLAECLPLIAGYGAGLSPQILLDNPNVPEDQFWGWMCAPDVYFRVKTFGLWAKQQDFLAKNLFPGERVFVEERKDPFDCPMAHNLAMLADGSFTPCCLDYEGEIGFGNIREISAEDALRSEIRAETIKNAGIHRICRRCWGKAFAYDAMSSSPESAAAELSMYGSGWWPFDSSLFDEGGRWSKGDGSAYFFAGSEVEALSIRCRAPIEYQEPAELLVCGQLGEGDDFEPILRLPFRPRHDCNATETLPISLPAGRLYRLSIRAPVFQPSRFGSLDDRELGLAVLSLKALMAGRQ